MVGSEDQYQKVRDLAVAALRRKKIFTTARWSAPRLDDELTDASGYIYHLHNLNLICADSPESEWPRIVDSHFAGQLAAQSEPKTEELSEPELLAQIRTRLQFPAGPSSPVPLSYARPAFGGLVAELNRDLPTTVITLGDRQVADRDLDFLYTVGQRNTDAEPYTIETLSTGSAIMWRLSGDSLFIASKALNMAHVVATVLKEAPLGVIFGVPHRHLLYLHPVADSSVFEALEVIAQLMAEHAEKPPGGCISTDVYYWYSGAVQTIARTDNETGNLQIDIDGAFADALLVANVRLPG